MQSFTCVLNYESSESYKTEVKKKTGGAVWAIPPSRKNKLYKIHIVKLLKIGLGPPPPPPPGPKKNTSVNIPLEKILDLRMHSHAFFLKNSPEFYYTYHSIEQPLMQQCQSCCNSMIFTASKIKVSMKIHVCKSEN